MVYYENSIIYKLKHNEDYDDNNIYIGSTSNFKNRKYHHKNQCCNQNYRDYNFPVYQFIRANGGWDEWIMTPIEEYSCDSKKELEIRERYHIDFLKPTLNKNIPTRTKQEYREANREHISKKIKEWNIANRETVLEKRKEYNYKKLNMKIICDNCGCETSLHNLKNHQKTPKCLEKKNIISNPT